MTKRDFNTNFLKLPFYNWCICLLIGLALATSHITFAQTNTKLIPKTAKKMEQSLPSMSFTLIKLNTQ